MVPEIQSRAPQGSPHCPTTESPTLRFPRPRASFEVPSTSPGDTRDRGAVMHLLAFVSMSSHSRPNPTGLPRLVLSPPRLLIGRVLDHHLRPMPSRQPRRRAFRAYAQLVCAKPTVVAAV